MVTAEQHTGERDANPTSAPWCELAQKELAGIKTDDVNRIDMVSVYGAGTKAFEDTRVAYSPVEGSDHVQFNVSGHNKYYSGLL